MTQLDKTHAVTFTNKGRLDLTALTTFGVSVKDNESPIGYFGTGLKYGIAVLLRHDQDVIVRVGHDERYTFSKKPTEVRGTEFDVVTITDIDGDTRDLGFTTALGRDWELWMTLREIESNCRDEAGTKVTATDTYNPDTIGTLEDNTTSITVIGKKFYDLYNGGETVFLSRDLEPRLTLNSGKMEVYKTDPTPYLFYRGVRVYKSKRDWLCTYNITDGVSLTEDRTLKHSWTAIDNVTDAVLTATNKDFIRLIVTAEERYTEHYLDFNDRRVCPSSTFLTTVRELIDENVEINDTAKDLVESLYPWDLNRYDTYKPSKTEMDRINKCVSFLVDRGFNIDKYPIKFFTALGKGTLAMAHKGQILLTQELIMQGEERIKLALLEEFFHLKHVVSDETREFQTLLLTYLIYTLGLVDPFTETDIKVA